MEALMTKFNVKSSMLSLAVLVTLSSCGKSKELNTPANPAPVTPQQQIPAPTVLMPQSPDKAKNAPDINTNPDNELLPDDGKSVVKLKDKKDADNKESDKKDQSNSSSAGVENSDKQLPHQIDFSNQVAVKTGGASKDLLYTSAGDDGLMEEFKAYGLKVSKEQQQMNANLARAITGARLVSLDSGDMQLDMVVDETIGGVGGMKNYRMKATAENNMLKLSAVNSNGDLEFQGGFIKCLDMDGSCSNAYAKIKLSGAYTRIIFRNSYANMHFLTQKDITNNLAFDMMKTYINNTSTGSSSEQKIDSLEIASFEVTNGRAAMGAMLVTEDNQMIGLSIPLVVSAKNSEVNSTVMKSADLSKSFALPSGINLSQKLASGISEVKLVNNNGLGQLKLKLSVGTGSNKGSVWMITSPVKKSLMSLEDVRQFESTVKSF